MSKSHEVGCGPPTVHSMSIQPCLVHISDRPVSLNHTTYPISLFIMHVLKRVADTGTGHISRVADIQNIDRPTDTTQIFRFVGMSFTRTELLGGNEQVIHPDRSVGWQ